MEVVFERACGMDIHKDNITACILTSKGKEIHAETRPRPLPVPVTRTLYGLVFLYLSTASDVLSTTKPSECKAIFNFDTSCPARAAACGTSEVNCN